MIGFATPGFHRSALADRPPWYALTDLPPWYALTDLPPWRALWRPLAEGECVVTAPREG